MCQWAEIQARSRKMPVEEFLALAEEKKQQLHRTLEVHVCMLGAMHGFGYTCNEGSTYMYILSVTCPTGTTGSWYSTCTMYMLRCRYYGTIG